MATLGPEVQKPNAVLLYNIYKGSVDLTDQITDQYTIMRTTNRWTLALFFNLIDVCISNAYLLFIAANPTWKPNDRSRRRIFMQWLAKNLAYEHVKQRRNTPGLQNSVISKIDTFLDNYSSLYLPKSCNYCSSTEELQSCEACKQTTCSIHYVNCTLYLCPNCAGNSEHQFLAKVQGRKRCEFCRFKPNSKTSVQCHNCSAYVCNNFTNIFSKWCDIALKTKMAP